MEETYAITRRGVALFGARFGADVPDRTGGSSEGDRVPVGATDRAPAADTVVIAITGIHGNFYSNPFYYNVGDTLAAADVDFMYAQTCDAFGRMRTVDVTSGREATIGSYNEDFADAVDDVGAWVSFAEQSGYRHIVLAGHSLGANKVIRYLSETCDPRVERFLLLSPANVRHLTSVVTPGERSLVRRMVDAGQGDEMLPFPLLGWIDCVASTAAQWLFTDVLDNVHLGRDEDFSQVEAITHEGALLVGAYDTFAGGDPAGFLRNINDHMRAAERNRLVFIEGTGHTYQQHEQELADNVLGLVRAWESEGWGATDVSDAGRGIAVAAAPRGGE